MLDAQRKRSAPQAATSRMFLFSGNSQPAKNQVQAAKVTSVVSAGAPTNQYRPTMMGCLKEAMTGSDTNKTNATPNVMKNDCFELSKMPKTARRIRKSKLKCQPTARLPAYRAASKTASDENLIQPILFSELRPILSQIAKTTPVDSPSARPGPTRSFRRKKDATVNRPAPSSTAEKRRVDVRQSGQRSECDEAC